MVRVSQQRDLYDPDVIDQFAAFVENADQLRMLTLLTVSDSLGTSRDLWNGFKDGLLTTLYHLTSMKVSGGTDFLMAAEKQRQRLRDEVRQLAPRTFSDDEIDGAFTHFPERYFHIHNAEVICRDLALAHQFMHLQLTTEDRALEPVVYWHNEPDRGFTEFKICTWDRLGLFVKTAGALSAAGLNIHGAHIYSRSDGISLDSFEVIDADSGGLATKKAKEHAEEILTESLSGRLEVDFSKMIVERKYIPPIYQALEDERIETVLRFDNRSSKTHTIVDVETEDRVGLLYFISNALNELGFSIDVARISTEKGAAIDTFYVTDWTGAKVEEVKDQEFLERKIRFAIKRLDKALTRRKKKKAS
jgi:[protein-PII] uridylyltransferase